MGTVLFGRTSDDLAAEALARRYSRYNPYLVKKTEPIHGVIEPTMGWYSPRHGVVGYRTTEFTRDEQTALRSRIFLDLTRFHFLLGQSLREGELPTTLRRISIEQLDPGQYAKRAVTDPLRAQLMQRDGVSEQAILAEIATRFPAAVSRQSTAAPAHTLPAVPAAPGNAPPGARAGQASSPNASPGSAPAGGEQQHLPPLRPRPRKPPRKQP